MVGLTSALPAMRMQLLRMAKYGQSMCLRPLGHRALVANFGIAQVSVCEAKVFKHAVSGCSRKMRGAIRFYVAAGFALDSVPPKSFQLAGLALQEVRYVCHLNAEALS